jgi:DNA anti-recombination protein RmuC
LQLKAEHPAEPEEDQDYGIPLGAGLAPVEKSQIRRGVVKELTAWLKHKLVRRLVDDRAQLLEAQKLATRMATTLDTRLARIEAQIQQQNQAYIHRIEELNRELAAAREENRELIRERIAQVKAEMEAARARVLAEANLDNTSLRL